MKKSILFLLFCLVAIQNFAQLNMELVGRLDYEPRLNDIWGYVAPDGTEYALVGGADFVSIVSLADPANPVEVASIPGDETVWRDLKTWGDYAYVTADVPSEDGLLIIDLSNLPNSVDFINWNPTFPIEGEENDSLFDCHNLYIDEFGVCYLAGCNLNEGGVIMLDVATNPTEPQFLGRTDPVYSHDVYARNNLLFSSEIGEGRFSIFDVTDKQEPIKLGEQTTPFEFCHNAWLSDDGNTLFTTDERPNAFTAAYDVSNPEDIRFLDTYRPAETLGTGVIPHNVHVLNDYLVISHYTDGCIIVDAHEPDNLVEVGQFDTYEGESGGFFGDWGAYPFLPSGLILASDIQSGLFVLSAEFKRAAYLEGQVTSSETGVGLINAEITIQSDNDNFKTTNITGNYKTGQATAGTFPVRFKAIGFYDKIAEATLVNGEVTILNVELDPLPEFVFEGRILDAFNKQAIEGGVIFMEGVDVNYTTQSDADGNFVIPDVFEGEYTLYIGKWGYENLGLDGQLVAGTSNQTFELARVFEDNFNVDLGWTIETTTNRGAWERGIPIGTVYTGERVQAEVDTEDFGNRCFVTRNGPFDGRGGDIDNGETTLTTPNMDLTGMIEPVLSYRPWFVNLPILPDFRQRDSMYVSISNGIDTVLLEVIEDSAPEWREAREFKLSEFIEITDSMHVYFTAFDRFLTDDIADAGLDDFRVSDGVPNSAFGFQDENVAFGVFPNPFHNEMTIVYRSLFPFSEMKAILYNALGQEIGEYQLTNEVGKITLERDLAAGAYFLILEVDGIRSEAYKVLKGR